MSKQIKLCQIREEFKKIQDAVASSSDLDIPKCVLECALRMSWLVQQYPRYLKPVLKPESLRHVSDVLQSFFDAFDVSKLPEPSRSPKQSQNAQNDESSKSQSDATSEHVRHESEEDESSNEEESESTTFAVEDNNLSQILCNPCSPTKIVSNEDGPSTSDKEKHKVVQSTCTPSTSHAEVTNTVPRELISKDESPTTDKKVNKPMVVKPTRTSTISAVEFLNTASDDPLAKNELSTTDQAHSEPIVVEPTCTPSTSDAEFTKNDAEKASPDSHDRKNFDLVVVDSAFTTSAPHAEFTNRLAAEESCTAGTSSIEKEKASAPSADQPIPVFDEDSEGLSLASIITKYFADKPLYSADDPTKTPVGYVNKMISSDYLKQLSKKNFVEDVTREAQTGAHTESRLKSIKVDEIIEICAKRSTADKELTRSTLSTFNRQEFEIQVNFLYCNICQTCIYEIGYEHSRNEVHKKKVEKAFKKKANPEIWQVTGDGSLKCNLCSEKFPIKPHFSSDMHVLSKLYETSVFVTQEKARLRSIWKNVSHTVWNYTLFFDFVNGNEATYCGGCDEVLKNEEEKIKHMLTDEIHLLALESLSDVDFFSPYFGTFEKYNVPSGLYCAVCKIVATTNVEVESHVGQDLEHRFRLRALRLVFVPQFKEHLDDVYFSPTRDLRRYFQDTPLDKMVRSFTTAGTIRNLMNVIFLNMIDDWYVCSLCDEHIEESLREKHCEEKQHCFLEKCLLYSFKVPRDDDRCATEKVQKRSYQSKVKKSAIIEKCGGKLIYCVVCHAGFTNSTEANFHVNKSPNHSHRVSLFREIFKYEIENKESFR